MKYRSGFIANSSSSSFIVKKKGLSEEQKENIRLCGKLLHVLTYDSECREYNRNDVDGYGNKRKNIFVIKVDNLLSRSDVIEFFKSTLKIPKENFVYSGDD
jgi:hypothetical protein